MFNIVLVEPEIPQNTGNIARTCAATGSRLHLVEPLGFKIDDKKLKRAGLDYWWLLDINYYKNLDEFFEKNKGRFFFFSTKATKNHCQVEYKDGDYLVFGKETKGLPKSCFLSTRTAAFAFPWWTTQEVSTFRIRWRWEFTRRCARRALKALSRRAAFGNTSGKAVFAV